MAWPVCTWISICGQSLATDGSGNLIINNGQIAVTPVLDVMAVSASDEEGQITDFGGNIVSVNVAGNSFVMQGPYGFQEVIDVNANTQYNGSNSSEQPDGEMALWLSKARCRPMAASWPVRWS